jgi:hypothetical protein
MSPITPFEGRPNNGLTFAASIYASRSGDALTKGGCTLQESPRRSFTKSGLLTVSGETKSPVHSQELQSDPLSSLIEQRFHSS